MSSLSISVGSSTLGCSKLAVFGLSGCSLQNACTRFIFGGGQVPMFAASFAVVLRPFLVTSAQTKMIYR
jgi:hypothetical protein